MWHNINVKIIGFNAIDLTLNQGIDGHLVSGHVDGQGKIIDKTLEGESMPRPSSSIKIIILPCL
jgi:riboflavin synthase alpha subunit